MNITIRRTEPSDYPAIQRIMSDSRVVWGTLQVPFPSLETWRQRLAEPPEGLFSLVACVDGEVVGNLGLHTNPNRPRRRHAAEIGMMVRDNLQGQGVGTALMQAAVDLADRSLQIERLELQVYTDNERAIRLYKKFGFIVEGTLIHHAFRDGEFVNTFTMARLRPDIARRYENWNGPKQGE